MGLFVFIVIVILMKSESVVGVGSHTLSNSSDSAMCVCRPHVTINPPVCSRSPSKNSGIDSNSTTFQNIVSMEQMVTRRQLEKLENAVSGNQQNVSAEIQGVKQQLKELQVSVSALVELIHDTSSLSEVRSSDSTVRTTSTEADTFPMSQVRTAVPTERTSTMETDTFPMSTTVPTERTSTMETDTFLMSRARTAVPTERTSTMETDTFPMSQARTAVPTDRTSTMETDTFPMSQARTAVPTDRTAMMETVALPKDCSEILAMGVSMSGVYTVQPLDSGEAFQVYCDMETDGGGWTVFQRRMDGSVDFYLDFAKYSQGFGNLEGEFWLGNDNLHRLTAQGEYELRVDMSDFETESRYAAFDSFSIADVSDNYRLTVATYSGTAGDSLSYHNNHQFTTKDQDNDEPNGNCAQSYHGAWWYGDCHYSNLNGAYLRGTTTERARGVVWYHWKGFNYSLKTSEMKIRPTPQ